MIVIGGASDFGIWRLWGRLVHIVGVWVVVMVCFGLEGGMDGLGWEVMTMIPPFFSHQLFSWGRGTRGMACAFGILGCIQHCFYMERVYESEITSACHITCCFLLL